MISRIRVIALICVLVAATTSMSSCQADNVRQHSKSETSNSQTTVETYPFYLDILIACDLQGKVLPCKCGDASLLRCGIHGMQALIGKLRAERANLLAISTGSNLFQYDTPGKTEVNEYLLKELPVCFDFINLSAWDSLAAYDSNAELPLAFPLAGGGIDLAPVESSFLVKELSEKKILVLGLSVPDSSLISGLIRENGFQPIDITVEAEKLARKLTEESPEFIFVISNLPGNSVTRFLDLLGRPVDLMVADVSVPFSYLDSQIIPLPQGGWKNALLVEMQNAPGNPRCLFVRKSSVINVPGVEYFSELHDAAFDNILMSLEENDALGEFKSR